MTRNSVFTYKWPVTVFVHISGTSHAVMCIMYSAKMFSNMQYALCIMRIMNYISSTILDIMFWEFY